MGLGKYCWKNLTCATKFKTMNYLKITFVSVLVLVSTVMNAQEASVIKSPTFQFKNGIGVTAPDSSFSLNFRFRMQARSNYVTKSTEDFSASEIEARIRRMRLRFEGFVLNPKINYYIQLSFSRGDMDWDDADASKYNSSPNVVRDAVIIYKPTKRWNILFGQTKLPGNRQRVNSSGELQFYDRSIVNSTFNIDRDFGLQVYYNNHIGTFAYALKGAVTSGEGRNSNKSDAGLAYTGRIELLPLGTFTNKGDYFEGDLERESSPKISLCAGYHYNEGAYRTQGTIGKDLYQQRNLKSFIADFLIKYRGFAFATEYLNRNADNPITIDPKDPKKTSTVATGFGLMSQCSYIFKNNVEIAARYAQTNPTKSLETKTHRKEEYGVGLTKYLNKHRIKLQGNLFYLQDTDLAKDLTLNKRMSAVFQIELGL